jgi:queuosine precursor transporter
MNELLFFLHTALIFSCTLGALKLGKGALQLWVCLMALLANLFVLKQITLFGLQVTSSDIFAVGGILGLNFLQEYHGKKTAKKATTLCLYTLILFAVFSKIHLLYTPSLEDRAAPFYEGILSQAPRLLIASLFVFFIVQHADLYLFGKLRSSKIRIPFFARNLISLSLSQLLDTVLFTFIGLYGLIASPLDVIILSFFVKVLAISCLTPCALLAKKWMHKLIPSETIS